MSAWNGSLGSLVWEPAECCMGLRNAPKGSGSGFGTRTGAGTPGSHPLIAFIVLIEHRRSMYASEIPRELRSTVRRDVTSPFPMPISQPRSTKVAIGRPPDKEGKVGTRMKSCPCPAEQSESFFHFLGSLGCSVVCSAPAHSTSGWKPPGVDGRELARCLQGCVESRDGCLVPWQG